MKYLAVFVAFALLVTAHAETDSLRGEEEWIRSDFEEPSFFTMVRDGLSKIWNYFSGSEAAAAAGSYDEAAYKSIVENVVAVMERAAPSKESRVRLIEKALKQARLDGMTEHIDNLTADINVREYMERIAECGTNNEYLTYIMKKAAADPRNFFSQFNDADKVIPEAVAYMVMLDRLTHAARNDWKILEKMKETIDDYSSKQNWRSVANLFERAKKVTIDHVTDQYLNIHRTRNCPLNWGRRTLPLNIVEACLEDYRLGFDDNARCGLAIAFEAPGSDKFDFKTRAGPTTFSGDGNGIMYRPPLPKDYADMYSTWNMAFVSHYPDAPLFWAKLVNPQVFCYKYEPEEYVYNRAIALYIHIGYTIFGRLDRGQIEPSMDWHQDELTQMWAGHNYRAAGIYEKKLEQASGESQSWVKNKLKRTLNVFGESSKESLEEFGAFLNDISNRDDADSLSISDILKIAGHAGGIVYEICKAIFWG